MVHSLAKGEVASLGTPNSGGISNLVVGIGWDKSTQQKGKFLGGFNKKKGVDLDLVVVAMQGPDPVRYVGLDNVDPLRGTVVHSGDNQTGEGEGDDETVVAHLDRVPPQVTSLVYVATAFKKGTDFSKADNVEFNVYDASDGRADIVASYWPSLLGGNNAVAVAKVVRKGEGWDLVVLNEPGNIRQGDFNSILTFAIGK